MSTVKSTARRAIPSFREKEWVPLVDYQSLQAALREALDGWELEQKHPFRQSEPRIAELRARFLDDK